MSDNRTCATCGYRCHRVAEFHPFSFCAAFKAGRTDPWADFKWAAEQLGLGPLPKYPPLVRDLKGSL